MDKKYHVLWTGGLDSTSLLCSLLERGYEVKVSYVEIQNNEEQYKRELDAMHSIQDILMLEDDFNLVSQINGSNTCGTVFVDSNAINFKMLPMFVMHMLYTYDPDYTFALAYVSNDEFIGYTEDLKNAMAGFLPFYRYNFDGTDIPTPEEFNIEFPLVKVSKVELFNYLKRFGKKYFDNEYEIINHITYCETHLDKDYCGKCACCERIIREVPEMFNYQRVRADIPSDDVIEEIEETEKHEKLDRID